MPYCSSACDAFKELGWISLEQRGLKYRLVLCTNVLMIDYDFNPIFNKSALEFWPMHNIYHALIKSLWTSYVQSNMTSSSFWRFKCMLALWHAWLRKGKLQHGYSVAMPMRFVGALATKGTLYTWVKIIFICFSG